MLFRKITLILLTGISGCSDAVMNAGNNPDRDSTPLDDSAGVLAENIASGVQIDFEPSFGLLKLANRHDCSCAINETKFNLDGCNPRFALNCSDTLASSRRIALQSTAYNDRYWFSGPLPAQQVFSTSFPKGSRKIYQALPVVECEQFTSVSPHNPTFSSAVV